MAADLSRRSNGADERSAREYGATLTHPAKVKFLLKRANSSRPFYCVLAVRAYIAHPIIIVEFCAVVFYFS